MANNTQSDIINRRFKVQQLFATGLSLNQIAKICEVTVSTIRRDKTWLDKQLVSHYKKNFDPSVFYAEMRLQYDFIRQNYFKLLQEISSQADSKSKASVRVRLAILAKIEENTSKTRELVQEVGLLPNNLKSKVKGGNEITQNNQIILMNSQNKKEYDFNSVEDLERLLNAADRENYVEVDGVEIEAE